jgi:hypothetical protein
MKRILFLCCIAVASTCTVAMAQSGPSTISTQPNPKTLFNSHVGKYDAGIARSNTAMAQAGFTEAMGFISNSIQQLSQQMKSASSQANKAAINAKMQAQQQIYTDLQALQSNIVSNATQIKAKFTAFEAVI